MPDTLTSRKQRSYYQVRHLARKLITGRSILLNDKKKYLLVTDNWSSGHFHWFCEVLPKLFCLKDQTKQFSLLLPDTSYIRTIGAESLTMLGLEFTEIIWMKHDRFYKVKDLFYVSAIAPSGHMHKELLQQIRNEFIGGKETGHRRIYISRAQARFRKILNEKELMNILQGYGFEMYHAEDVSLSGQVAVFCSCNTLLGIHGAGLTNCIFMQPGSKVIELRRKENGPSNVGYWHLADSLDHHYYYYNGVPDSGKPLVGRGCNLTIPVEDFSHNIIDEYLAGN